MKFTNIEKAIYAEELKNFNSTIQAIGNNDAVLSYYLTKLMHNRYTSGTITRAEAEKAAAKRFKRINEKKFSEKLSKLAELEKTCLPEGITISIEWKRSATWGKNPHVSVYAWTGTAAYEATGTASGCNYDKESAAIAQALNKIPAIIKALAETKEKYLSYNENSKAANEKALSYGAGNGAIPYFEGGTGKTVYMISESGKLMCTCVILAVMNPSQYASAPECDNSIFVKCTDGTILHHDFSELNAVYETVTDTEGTVLADKECVNDTIRCASVPEVVPASAPIPEESEKQRESGTDIKTETAPKSQKKTFSASISEMIRCYKGISVTCIPTSCNALKNTAPPGTQKNVISVHLPFT